MTLSAKVWAATPTSSAFPVSAYAHASSMARATCFSPCPRARLLPWTGSHRCWPIPAVPFCPANRGKLEVSLPLQGVASSHSVIGGIRSPCRHAPPGGGRSGAGRFRPFPCIHRLGGASRTRLRLPETMRSRFPAWPTQASRRDRTAPRRASSPQNWPHRASRPGASLRSGSPG